MQNCEAIPRQPTAADELMDNLLASADNKKHHPGGIFLYFNVK